MPSNVELKARVRDVKTLIARAQELCGGKQGQLLRQCDTFFKANHGRLKLREFGDKLDSPNPELIFYNRPDESGPKLSDFVRADLGDSATASNLKQALGEAVGVRGVLKKERLLFLPRPNIRIHIDKVEGLGNFMEIEVCLKDDITTSAMGEKIANQLLEKLGICDDDLISGAYMDALEKENNQNIHNSSVYE